MSHAISALAQAGCSWRPHPLVTSPLLAGVLVFCLAVPAGAEWVTRYHQETPWETTSDPTDLDREVDLGARILRYPDGRVTVWVINPHSEPPTVSEKRITTGHSFDGMITIREGIQAGDVVVVRGNESLQEGQQVRIQRRQ